MHERRKKKSHVGSVADRNFYIEELWRKARKEGVSEETLATIGQLSTDLAGDLRRAITTAQNRRLWRRND